MRKFLAKKPLRVILTGVVLMAGASTLLTLALFPWDVDPERDETAKTAEFYRQAYTQALDAKPASGPAPILTPEEQAYADRAREAATDSRVPELVAEFVRKYSLQDKKVLDVGAGNGFLQDAVADYVGLDISPTARRFFHKPFVEASATDMPFPNGTFDALWSVWVMEHIPNPEAALREMRRVLKPGGVMFLMPAWQVSRYHGQGYAVRSYADFGWTGKVVKASIPIAQSNVVHYLHEHQVRALRSIGTRLWPGPSTLHFTRLKPDYEHYWQPDSDAAISLSLHETYLWFASRGDQCLNCPDELTLTLRDPDVFFLEIRKAQ